MCVLNHVHLPETPWIVACQAPLSMGFSRQEYWSGLPFPSPRDLPNPGIKPRSPALAGRFFTSHATREAQGGILVLPSHVQLFVTLWTAALQASLSFTNSVTLSNHLILCCPLLLLPSIFSRIKVFYSELALHIKWPK